MVSDQALTDLFNIASSAVQRADQAIQLGMSSGQQAHGLYAADAHGVASAQERLVSAAIFLELMAQRYPAKHRLEVRCEYPYPPPDRKLVDLALLEPDSAGKLALAACIELKLWSGTQRETQDVAKMRKRCPQASVRKLLMLLWGVPDVSMQVADWVGPQLPGIGVTFNPRERQLQSGRGRAQQASRPVALLAMMEAHEPARRGVAWEPRARRCPASSAGFLAHRHANMRRRRRLVNGWLTERLFVFRMLLLG
jgi:hypothetical protein